VKILIIGLHLLILLAGTSTLYGTLESMVNIIEGILMPFTSDPSTAGALVFGGVFMIAFVAAMLALLVGAPLLVSVVAAGAGGIVLRKFGRSFSRSAGRALVLAALATNIAFVLAAEPANVFLRGRPRVKPRSPVLVLACAAGANAALSAFVAALILRKLAPESPVSAAPDPAPRTLAHH
jgi:hypothetical protein